MALQDDAKSLETLKAFSDAHREWFTADMAAERAGQAGGGKDSTAAAREQARVAAAKVRSHHDDIHRILVREGRYGRISHATGPTDFIAATTMPAMYLEVRSVVDGAIGALEPRVARAMAAAPLDEQIRSRATRNVAALQRALNIHVSWRAALVAAERAVEGSPPHREQLDIAAKARSDWNIELSATEDALIDAPVQKVFRKDGAEVKVMRNAMRRDPEKGYDYANPARAILETGIGFWMRVERDPSVLKKGSPSQDSQALALVAPVTDPSVPIDPSKVPLSKILLSMTPGQWVRTITILVALLGASFALGKWIGGFGGERAEQATDDCKIELGKARAAAAKPIGSR